jgi:DMSO/TMAO reductase YedYZ molybdopterin-dependent catalytic subunit
MKRSFWLMGALVGFLTSLITMAFSYLGNLWLSLSFFPFDLFDWLTRHLPGSVIEFVLQRMISLIAFLHLGPTASTAKLAEQIQALGLVSLTGVVFGLVLAWVLIKRRTWLIRAGLLGGVFLWLGMAVVEISLPTLSKIWVSLIWFFLLLVGWGWQLARFLEIRSRVEVVTTHPPQPSTEVPESILNKQISRRNMLALVAASITSAAVLLSGLVKLRRAGEAASTTPAPGLSGTSVPLANKFPYGPEYTSGPAASPSLAALTARIDPAAGTRPEITRVADFYRIDINTVPPKVDAATWRLNLTGLVKNPISLSLDQILLRPAVSQAVTLSCISNLIGGDLIGTNYWTGIRLKDLLNEAVLQPNAFLIAFTSADGYYEGLALKEAMDERTLLVYAMNGELLTAEHGFPLRIFVPDHYGMRQPKWITEMNVIDGPNRGYWTARGWSASAVPMTTSVIDTQDINASDFKQTGIMPLGGIAYAGDRGITKVEVQIDEDPWVEAELRAPAISPLTWVQWRFEWKPAPGTHIVGVRATDGAGVPQELTLSYPSPEGATGIHKVTFNI